MPSSPDPPAKTGRDECAPGQVSWLSDRPTPRAFPASRPVASAGFVPDYSDGVAAASNRLPWGPSRAPEREQRPDGNRLVGSAQWTDPRASGFLVLLRVGDGQ